MLLRKRVLVTGGSGFLGSRFCKRMIHEGCEIMYGDTFFTNSRQNIAHLLSDLRFKGIGYDITPPLDVERNATLRLAYPSSSAHCNSSPRSAHHDFGSHCN